MKRKKHKLDQVECLFSWEYHKSDCYSQGRGLIAYKSTVILPPFLIYIHYFFKNLENMHIV